MGGMEEMQKLNAEKERLEQQIMQLREKISGMPNGKAKEEMKAELGKISRKYNRNFGYLHRKPAQKPRKPTARTKSAKFQIQGLLPKSRKKPTFGAGRRL